MNSNQDWKQELDDDAPSGLVVFFARNWPYLTMLSLALVGVALSSTSPGSMIPYWEALVPVFALVCFAARGLPKGAGGLIRSARLDLLHWLAVFLAMRLLMLPDLTQMLNSDAIALMLLTVLALGTFTAGNQVGSWRIALVGFLLAAAVPAIAWVERTALLLTLACVGVASITVFVLTRRSADGP